MRLRKNLLSKEEQSIMEIMNNRELEPNDPESADSTFSSQVSEFTREMYFLHQEMMSLRCHVEADLSDDFKALRDRLEELYPGSSGKKSDDYELIFKIFMALTQSVTPPTMGNMSSSLGITLSAATRLVAGLVDNGYAERLADPEDRRIVRVTLTDKGREVFKALRDLISHRASLVLKRFTEEERILLILLLRKLTKNLNEQKLSDQTADNKKRP